MVVIMDASIFEIEVLMEKLLIGRFVGENLKGESPK